MTKKKNKINKDEDCIFFGDVEIFFRNKLDGYVGRSINRDLAHDLANDLQIIYIAKELDEYKTAVHHLNKFEAIYEEFIQEVNNVCPKEI